MSLVSIVCRAASLEAATTKSVKVRPCISAARFSIACTGRAGELRDRQLVIFVFSYYYIYGNMTYKVKRLKCLTFVSCLKNEGFLDKNTT